MCSAKLLALDDINLTIDSRMRSRRYGVVAGWNELKPADLWLYPGWTNRCLSLTATPPPRTSFNHLVGYALQDSVRSGSLNTIQGGWLSVSNGWAVQASSRERVFSG